MRNFLLTFSLLVVTFTTGFSQVPNAFNYQAVVRNNSGDIVANQDVNFKISLLQDSETGTSVYSETHLVTTSNFGLANLKIGKGTVVDGIFSPGDWGVAPHFIKIEIDPAGGSTFVHLGTSQLLAVPYAFHANTVENDAVDDADADATNELQTIDLNGSQLTLSDGGGTVNLPTEAASPWEDSNDGIQYNAGKVGIGHDPADDTGMLQIWGDNNPSIEAVNNSATYPTIYIQNQNGDAAYFDGSIVIEDGTEGAGKILTSDANGNASWQTSATASSIWTTSNDNIYFNTGKVGIGEIPTDLHLRQFQVRTENLQAVAAVNDGTYAALFAENLGTGPAADFRNKLRIYDGTQGAGKVLTSDANGLTSWQTPSSGSLWTQNGSEIYFNDNVGIGISNPLFKLDVSNSTGETYARIQSIDSNASLIVERAGSSDGASIIYKTGGALSFHTGLLSSSSYKISTTNPILNGLEVEFDGDVKLSDELHSTNTGNSNMMPFAYGYITSTGTKSSATSNVGTVTKTGTGQYTINIADLGSGYIAMVTPNYGSAYLTGVVSIRNSTDFRVTMWDTKDDVYKDGGFSFIIYKP